MDTVLPEGGGQAPLTPIARLGKYTLIKPLAKGGMAQVFLAQRDGSADICVLKQLLGDVAEHETAVKRFHREAKLAAYLSHRHIARVLDAGFEGGTFCIAMEYVLGKDLEAMSHHLVKQGRLLPYPVSLASILGALDGLAYAHKATDPGGKPLQLVHRDLSPRNVMLSTSGVVKVIDFGVARSDSGDFRTAPGMLVGTLRYVSPEQAVAEPVDARSDLYSLSVVLHELLTGHYLVPSGEPMKVLRHVVTESLPPVHTLNPDLPPELGEVIARGLAKNRDERWPDAATYRQALLEAAGPLAEAEESQLGSFVRSFFEDEMAVGEAVISFGKERFVQEVKSASETQARSLSEKTRTGFVAASEVVPGPLGAGGDGPPHLAGEEPPHLGTVVPVELTSPGASTASLMRSESQPGSPSVLSTHQVKLEPANMQRTRTAMFQEVEAKAMVDAAQVQTSAEVLADVPQGLRSGRGPKLALAMVGVMSLAVLGAVVVAELRGPNAAVEAEGRGVQTSLAEAEATPRPVAVQAEVVAAEPAPEPVVAGRDEVVPQPQQKAKPAAVKPKTTPATAGTPAFAEPAPEAPPTKSHSRAAALAPALMQKLDKLDTLDKDSGDEWLSGLEQIESEVLEAAKARGLSEAQLAELRQAFKSSRVSRSTQGVGSSITKNFQSAR